MMYCKRWPEINYIKVARHKKGLFWGKFCILDGNDAIKYFDAIIMYVKDYRYVSTYLWRIFV